MVDSSVKNIPIKMETVDDFDEEAETKSHCLLYPKKSKHKSVNNSNLSGVNNLSNNPISDISQVKEEMSHNEMNAEPKEEMAQEVFIITELEEGPTNKITDMADEHQKTKSHPKSPRTSNTKIPNQSNVIVTTQTKCTSSENEDGAESPSTQKTKKRQIRVQCPVCFKGFSGKFSMKIHLRIHTGETPFTCDICQKSFRAQENLTNHKKWHMGEKYKRHKCEYCDKMFIRTTDRKVHMRKHTEALPFKCKICNYGYKSNSYLKLHMQRDHNMTLEVEEVPKKPYKEPPPDPSTIKVFTEDEKKLRSEVREKLKQKMNGQPISESSSFDNATKRLVSKVESASTNTAMIKEEIVDFEDVPSDSFVRPTTSIVKEEEMITSYYVPED